MTLAEHLTAAVRAAVNETFATEVQEIVAKEAGAAFREHESQFAVIIRSAVKQAITEILETAQ